MPGLNRDLHQFEVIDPVNVPRLIRRLFRKPYDGLRHHGVVEEGVLYRCGQPTPAQLEELIRQYSIKTVVSLRGKRAAGDPDAWEQAEQQTCAAHGADFVTLPCNHKNPPTAEQVEQFLELMRDQSRQPVLVHCRIGQQRTILFCGLYRMHLQAVTPAEALREMDELGFDSGNRRHERLLEAFHDFSPPRFKLSRRKGRVLAGGPQPGK